MLGQMRLKDMVIILLGVRLNLNPFTI
ncbi:MAG: hypothetical protein F083_1316, partial [bacterium F083]